MEGTNTADRRLRRAALAAALITCVAAMAAASPAKGSYVALGDSYAAGPLIPNQVSPLGCLKSSNNYARLTAPRIGRPLTDVSCSGAKTTNMLNSQSITGGSNPPQFNALNASTEVVSLTISGNDIGFSEIAQNCVTLNPFGSPCRKRYIVNGTDTVSQRITAAAPLVDAVLDGIRLRSPAARVFVTNYPAILPETGIGCYPRMPIAFNDVSYLRAKQQELNAMVAAQTSANGATLVNWYQASIGRDACKSSSVRWVEPIIPGNWAASIHPNRRGMEGAANLLVPAVNGG